MISKVTDTVKPICYDLFCGLGGWTEGFLAEGYECIGYDIEKHDYGTGTYPGTLILCDVRSIHGSQLKDATIIVASPPCQDPSWRAMPWKAARALTPQELGVPKPAWWDKPEKSSEKIKGMNAEELAEWHLWQKRSPRCPPELFIELFNECFRIQREASEAAGHYIPLIVENVRGAEEWVGSARWHFGSYYLWGDVPALMPPTFKASKVPGFRFDGQGSFQTASYRGIKSPGTKFSEVGFNVRNAQRFREEQGRKQPGIGGTRKNGKGDAWFQDGAARHGSKSDSRKAASAEIAKIPFPLAQHIARVFKPHAIEAVG